MGMDNQGSDGTTLLTTGPHPCNGRRLVLMPFPFQGHINPMLQLASILHSRGFKITILHSNFNSPNPANHRNFIFVPIPDEFEYSISGSTLKTIDFIRKINEKGVGPIRECLGRLMAEDPTVACLITDAQWSLTQKVADELRLPRIVHRTSSVASFLAFAAFPLLRDNKSFFGQQELKSEASLPDEVAPLKIADLPRFLSPNPEPLCELLELMVNGTRPAAAIIWNSFKELEELALPKLRQVFPNNHFLIGPFHKYSHASTSSLLAQDRSVISWLDNQRHKSVLYVSFGSLAAVEETEFLEIAWGLANSKQPFLWVVRPGVVSGSKNQADLLPDGFLDEIGDRGRIVKWAPQEEVLAHPATGGFWTHCGWNSTLESICEGVPMICSPCFGDQLPNARYITEVWRVGLHLENRLQRRKIEMAIRKLMMDKEGLEMRERAMCLKEKVDLCLNNGGSSYSSLEDLVNFILSF